MPKPGEQGRLLLLIHHSLINQEKSFQGIAPFSLLINPSSETSMQVRASAGRRRTGGGAAPRWSSLAGVNQSDRCGIINLKIHFFTQLAIASKNISHMKCLIMPYCHWKGYLICLVFFFCWLC